MLSQLFYLSDLSILTNISFKDHLLKLEMVIERVSTTGITFNIFKSKFFVKIIIPINWMIFKPNKLQFTAYHQKANAMIEQVHNVVSCQ
jgi:hypothetical protein